MLNLNAKPLLPLEPHVADNKQHSLSAQYLESYESDLLAMWNYLRASADEELSCKNLRIDGKAYPYGQCYQISTWVLDAFPRILSQKAKVQNTQVRSGLDKIETFLRAGGEIRRIWGDLRGEYFQNALQVGSYYVDVSNDTVDATKPPVEILPFNQAKIFAIKDFNHFADMGRRYWKREFYANTVFPQLAPLLPLFSVGAQGDIRFEGNDYTLALASENNFALSKEAIESFPKLSKEWVEILACYFKDSKYEFVATADFTLAQKACIDHANSPPLSYKEYFNTSTMSLIEINKKLEKIKLTGEIK